MATDPYIRLLNAAEFLQIEFGPDMKAELDEGMIRMMAGGSREHARVQMNLYGWLRANLRGSGCRPFGSDMAIETAERSVRYPDLTIDCGTPSDAPEDRILREPRVIIEVLSPSTRRSDEGAKLAEYRSLPSVDTIALIDPETERCRVLQRTGPSAWSDVTYTGPAAIELPSLNVTIPHTEIFARD